jgi:hypothetical protein
MASAFIGLLDLAEMPLGANHLIGWRLVLVESVARIGLPIALDSSARVQLQMPPKLVVVKQTNFSIVASGFSGWINNA